MDESVKRFALLSELLTGQEWRERISGRMVFGDGEHARFSTAFQFGLDREFVERNLGHRVGSSVDLLLPLTTRDKRLLLNFELRGPAGQDAFLLSRDQIARLQAAHVLDMLSEAGIEIPSNSNLVDLLQAICAFTPALFESSFLADAGNDQERALTRYLTDGLSSAFAVTEENVKDWRRLTSEVRDPLLAALKEPPRDLSSAEEVLLALPLMSNLPSATSVVVDLLNDYAQVVAELAHRNATDALRALADSGRRWIMIAELSAPVGRRFEVYLSEDCPLNRQSRRLRGWLPRRGLRSRQRFALGDATSAHLEIRLADPNLILRNFQPLDPLGKKVGFGDLEDVRRTDEAFSLYSSVGGRPRFLDIEFDLRLSLDLGVMSVLVVVLGAAAICAALLLSAGANLFTGLAVVTVPITVATALLAVREQTALASQLQAGRRLVVLVITILLWAVVITRLLWPGVELPLWHGHPGHHPPPQPPKHHWTHALGPFKAKHSPPQPVWWPRPFTTKRNHYSRPCHHTHRSIILKRSRGIMDSHRDIGSTAASDHGPPESAQRDLIVPVEQLDESGSPMVERVKRPAPTRRTGLWTKLDTSSDRFMKLKESGGSFKGVKRER